jgi:hypothetical protein
MRIWEFDRVGGIASEQFDINEDGQQFVLAVLGFLWMNNEELGFDPTIQVSEDGQRFIEIKRNNNSTRHKHDPRPGLAPFTPLFKNTTVNSQRSAVSSLRT